MPETRGEPLETIQEVFSKPLRVHGVDRLRLRKGAKGTAARTTPSETDLDDGLELASLEVESVR